MYDVRLSLCIPHCDPWHSGGRRGRVCCGNHNVEKVVLHLYFDVVLFCRHVGLLLPLVHSPSWIPTKQQKRVSSTTSFSLLFYLLAQSVFFRFSGSNLVLPSGVPVDQEIKIPPQSWEGGFCEDSRTVFSHCHSLGLFSEASALPSNPFLHPPPSHPSPKTRPDCRVPSKV